MGLDFGISHFFSHFCELAGLVVSFTRVPNPKFGNRLKREFEIIRNP
jgi:hypothetical protein